MQWDDECAALAESLLSRPKASNILLLSSFKALMNALIVVPPWRRASILGRALVVGVASRVCLMAIIRSKGDC